MPRTTAGTRTASGPRPIAKNFGTCLYFDGVNDKLAWGNILLSQTVVSAACTFLLPTDGASNFDIIFGYGNTRWFFIVDGNSGSRRKIAFSIKSSTVEKSSGYLTNNLFAGKFYLAIGTYDPNGGTNNTTLRVYNSNGTLVEEKLATQTGAIDSTDQPLEAAHDPNRGFYIDMYGDEFRVYSRILTLDEQNGLALGVEPDSSGLELYAKLDEGSGSSANDSSGNNRTGTITGAVYSENVVSKGRTLGT